jgi:hypothetical protein
MGERSEAVIKLKNSFDTFYEAFLTGDLGKLLYRFWCRDKMNAFLNVIRKPSAGGITNPMFCLD